MPPKPLPLSQIRINCVINETLMHFNKNYLFINPFLAAILDAILNFQHTSDIIIDDMYFCCGQKDHFRCFFSGKCIKFPFNEFYGKNMFWRPFCHLESDAWEHYSLSVFGLANAPEVPPFD